VELLQSDPTGISTPWGQVVSAIILLAVIVVALRWLWSQRKR
jgi:hypothetical protein